VDRPVVDPRFPATLRRLREERGLSLRDLARLAYRSKSHLHEFETGAKKPSHGVARQLDEILRAGGQLAQLVTDPRPANRTPPSGLTVLDLLREPGRPMDADDVAALRDTITHLVALDNAYGADDISNLATRIFRTANRKLGAGAYRPAVERDLQAAVGEVGELAAWLLYDADRQTEARHASTEALFISRLAGDRSIELLQLAHMAMQSIHIGRSREALRIVEDVIDSNRLSGRVAGLFHIRRARALAELGDRPRALDDMARARSMLANEAGPSDPAWSWWVDDNELTWHEGMLHASLGQHHQAVDLFRAVADRSVTRGRRGYYNNLAHLLDALVTAGAWTDVEPVITDLLPYATEIGSARTEHLLQRVLARMARAPIPESAADAAAMLGPVLSADT